MKADKWDGWAMTVTLLACLTVAFSGFMIAQYGFIEVPTRTGQTRTDINVMVWSLAIGQGLGAILFAGLFNMVRDIYRNTCQQPQENKVPLPKLEEPEGFSGLLVERVRDASPLAGHVRAGYRLMAVNGRPAISEQAAAESVVDGVNTFTLVDTNGNEIERRLEMRPQPLHLRFAP